jgi:peptide-methionine (S)-S-oxide reductase
LQDPQDVQFILHAITVLFLLIVTTEASTTNNTETLVLGAGCFWCVEGIYENVEGVLDVESGFAGGHVPNPTYEQVLTGKTGHAEVVQITFDPTRVTLEKLVDLFWQIHDPTDPRGVWPDFGPMYRSILLGNSPEQTARLRSLKDAEQKNHKKSIVTEVAQLREFYPAEKYHQDFVRLNPDHPYVRNIALPKMEKAKKVSAGAPKIPTP